MDLGPRALEVFEAGFTSLQPSQLVQLGEVLDTTAGSRRRRTCSKACLLSSLVATISALLVVSQTLARDLSHRFIHGVGLGNRVVNSSNVAADTVQVVPNKGHPEVEQRLQGLVGASVLNNQLMSTRAIGGESGSWDRSNDPSYGFPIYYRYSPCS
jgi:hypothetical protein